LTLVVHADMPQQQWPKVRASLTAAWIAGSSPAMTGRRFAPRLRPFSPIHNVKQRRRISLVTTGLDPVVHADMPRHQQRKVRASLTAAWIAGSSPAMTR